MRAVGRGAGPEINQAVRVGDGAAYRVVYTHVDADLDWPDGEES